jgi:dihydrofolate reductase
LKAIAAVDQNWAIGREGKLLARIPGDLRYFREKTLGKILVMGRETLDSLPEGKPLPGRTTLVLSRRPGYEAPCTVLPSVEACLAFLSRFPGDDVFVAGGASIYEQFLPWCDACLITKIDAAFQADRHFENLDIGVDFQLIWAGEPRCESGLRYRFTEYGRRTVASKALPGNKLYI